MATATRERASASATPDPLPLAAFSAPAALALLAGLMATGATAATLLRDPGTLTRWALPITGLLVDLLAGLSIGLLVVAAGVLSPTRPAWARVRALAVVTTTGWAVAAVLRLILDYSSVAGMPLTSPGIGSQIGLYVTEVERGQLLLLGAVIVAITSTIVVGSTGAVGAGVALVGASLATLAVAFTGHSAGASFHELAVSSLWLHVLGLGIWCGGLAALIMSRPLLDTSPQRTQGLPQGELAHAVSRYSALAALGLALVAASGLGNSVIRLGSVDGLATSYGALLSVKVLLLMGLGAAGVVHRRRLIPALSDASAPDPAVRSGHPFARLALAELVLMGASAGLGVAMANSAPPLPDEPPANPTPAELVVGEPLPPEPTLPRMITEITPDILWAFVVAFLLVTYVAGVRALRRRGDRWPAHRVVLWVLGCLALLYVTCGGVAVYGRFYFSLHMVQHMALTMMAPLMLTFGAPMTLLLRACPARHDGSRGPREWVLGLIESRWVRFFAHPVIAAVNFAGSIIVFYFTPLFGLALRTHLGHELMMLHFVLAGYLFAQAIVGIDPGVKPLPYPMRLVLLFATMGFHAFFGVTVMGATSVMEATYFSSLGTGIDLLSDQAQGGSIAWGIGEIPTLILAIVMAVQWSRSDTRESRRRDRAADRDGDAELEAYNQMLTRIAASDHAVEEKERELGSRHR